MQISKRTLGILKNFATINQSILIEEGNTIETISNIKDVYAKVEVDETFPVTFAIYDLNEFMGVVSLFDADAEFEFCRACFSFTFLFISLAFSTMFCSLSWLSALADVTKNNMTRKSAIFLKKFIC